MVVMGMKAHQLFIECRLVVMKYKLNDLDGIDDSSFSAKTCLFQTQYDLLRRRA